MRYYKIGRSVFVSLLVVLSASFVPSLPVVLMTSGVLAQTVDARKAEADRLMQQGKELYENDEYQTAIKYFQKALNIYQEIKNVSGEEKTLINLGIVYTVLGNCIKTTEYYQQYLAITRKPNVSSTPRFREKRWRNYWFIDKRIKELQNYLDKIDMPEKDKREIVNKYKDAFANLYVDKSDTSKIITERIKAQLLLQKANKLHQTKNFDAAIKPYQEALRTYEYIKYYQGAIKAIVALGKNYMAAEKYAYANITFRHALIIASEIKDTNSKEYIQNQLKAIENKSNILNIKANSLYDQGVNQYKSCQTKLALNSWGQAQKISKKISNDIFYSAIIDFPKKALSAQIEKVYKQGHQLHEKGKNKQAIKFLHKALDYCKKFEGVCKSQIKKNILLTLGLAYDEVGFYTQAIRFYQQQLKIDQQTNNLEYIPISLYNLGLALLKSGNPQQAEFVLRQNIQNLEKNRPDGIYLSDASRISIFDEQQYPSYPILQKALIAQNKYEEALEISEQGRTRIFSDLLVRSLEPEKVYKGLLDFGIVNPENYPLNSKLPRFVPGDLIPKQPTAEIPSIDKIKQTAQKHKSTLVEYSIVESELYIWVIKPTGEVTFRKADLKPLWQKENTTLAQLVTTSRQSIGARGTTFRGIDVSFNPDAPKAVNKLKRLHELLINPIADLLPKNPSARVTFIPQESLFLVPFPALQDANGKYLIEKHTILTSPSIQVLELTRQKRQQIGKQPIQGNKMLIVGNPTMPKIPPKIDETPQQLIPLPGAEREAKAIAKLFKTQALIGDRATETKVTQRLPQARFIHLATHGIFDNLQGLNSGIALASSPTNKGNEKGDGLLTAGEILDLKLNAELVVLSACDTGRGEITGDGVIGLSRSLISAGVPSVLVSLWSVPDAPTEQLMTDFYQNLQNNPDKAQALRQAMLKRMKQHPNPRDWAAFTLIGEAE